MEKSAQTIKLYIKNKPLIESVTSKIYYKHMPFFNSKSMDLDDTLQESFVAFVKIMNEYNTQQKHKYKLSTYICNGLRWYFLRMIRNSRSCYSLDYIMTTDNENNPNEFNIIIPDKKATAEYNSIEKAIDNDILKSDLEAALNTISKEQRAHIIKHYINNISYVDIAKDESAPASVISSSVNRALKKLQKAESLAAYKEDLFYRYSASHCSVQQILKRGSNIEQAIIKAEKLQKTASEEAVAN